MRPKIVGLIGPKSSGKSTLATLLHDNEGYHRIPFAAPLKGMLFSLLSHQRLPALEIKEMLWGSKKEEPSYYLGGKSPRHAMQTLGTEWGRNLLHPNLWMDAWKRQATASTIRVVTEDVRFLNEVEAILVLGGVVLRIERLNLTTSNDSHTSEDYKNLPFNYKISNTSDPSFLLQQFRDLFKD